MRKLFSLLFWTGAFVAANAALAGGIAAATLYDRLPTLREIADYRPRLPLRIYAGDGGLIAEFGEEKREFTPYQEFPRDLLNAVIATEDAKFFQHPGLDFAGIVRAALGYFRGRREGASTITMQVAGNFYLNRDRSLLYKISQILLALKIENQFAKEDILELYMNQIYLGAGAFGFAAAARVYYGKELDELTAPEIAVLAGLPQAPSRYHPGQSPELAKARQRHVLNRMLDTQLLTETEHRQLSAAELPPLAPRVSRFSVEAEFFAEEVRKIIYEGVTHGENEIRGIDYNGDGICEELIDRDNPVHVAELPPDFIGLGEAAYQRGFNVYTTLDSDMQAAAVSALRSGLLAHESRRPYPGPEKFLDIKDLPREKILALLQREKTVGDIPPAVILDVNKRAVLALTPDGEAHEIRGEGLARVRKHLPGGGGKPALARGAVVRVIESPSEKNDSESETPKLIKRVVSIPKAEAALVALSPEDGAILAMAGGFDFAKAKFNHATQARRQLGSAIKPFIYSAALEKGFMPSKILYDAPKHYSKEETGSDEFWEPRNYDRKDDGPIRMRVALNKSKNFATFDLMWALRERARDNPDKFNFDYVMNFIERFGFNRKDHPPYLSLALGPGASTPLETARAYAVFANGGLLHHPYLIRRVEDYDGNVLIYGPDCSIKAIDPRNAFMMTSLLKSVVRDGTGRGALSLERGDLAGKTGTTNDTRDAWFAGYGGGVAAVSWIGYDDHSIPLGKNETGGRAALPIWRDFMGAALAGRPEAKYAPPANVIAMDIRAADGEPASPDDDDAISEYFYAEFLPSPPPDEEDEAEAVEELL